jgi:Derlin-2/3
LFIVFLDMLVTMSQRYEQSGPFNTGAGGGTADYAFAFLFGMILMLATYPLVTSMFPIPPIFTKNMVYYVMYIWSKRHPTAQANIWGIPLEAIYLPFAYLALTVFIGGSYFDVLHGLAIGHLYYFLADVYPQVSGKDILVTPRFLIDRFGIGDYRPAATAEVRANPQQAAGAPPAGGGHVWGGTGRPLGRQGEAAQPAGGHTWGTGGRPLGRQ